MANKETVNEVFYKSERTITWLKGKRGSMLIKYSSLRTEANRVKRLCKEIMMLKKKVKNGK